MKRKSTSEIVANIVGVSIAFALVAWNYWAGSVALFLHHPTYFQILGLTAILLTPVLLGSSKTPLARIMQATTLIAFLAWVLRLVGIMPNAPL